VGGFLTDLDAYVVAQTSWLLGAGRRELGQDIDPTAGVLCHAKPGQVVTQGQKLFTLMSNNESSLEQAHDKLVTGFACGSGQEVVDWSPLITERIQGKGHS
jgi:thymidine phosphorylase